MFKNFLFSIFVIFIFIALLEGVLRFKGHLPFYIGGVVKVVPGGKLYEKDPVLGFKPIPGKYTIYYKDGYQFSTTYLKDSTRITKPLDEYKDQKEKPEVWIFGDSYTNGYSLNDDKTFAYLLQKDFPNYNFVNFGVGGYSNVHSILQFKKALKTKKPAIIIICYSFFLDQRNAFSRSWRKAQLGANKLGQLAQPYAEFDNGKLVYKYSDITYDELPFERTLALSNWLDDKINAIEDKNSNSHNITEAVIRDFSNTAKKKNVKVIFSTFYNDPITKETLDYAKSLGMEPVDMSVDFSNGKYTNMPHDAHPSALANTYFEKKLKQGIKNLK